VAREGKLFVISGPSCSGKKVVHEGAMAREPNLVYCVSATTRPRRPGEVDGKDYFFLDEETFRRRVEEGAFVEWAEVHGHRYGTLWEELDRKLRTGNDVLLELDVQGMRNLRSARKHIVAVFIMAPSFEELEKRMRKRGLNEPEDIALRLRNAREEVAARDEYDYVVVNEVVENAVQDLLAIIEHERAQALTGST